jgi:hypothetical protein
VARYFSVSPRPSHHAPNLDRLFDPRHRIGLNIQIGVRFGFHGKPFLLAAGVNPHGNRLNLAVFPL